MPPNDFENLGFEINVGEKSYNTAVSRLDNIIERLEKIQKLQGVSGKGGNASGSSKPKLTEEEQYAKRVAKQTQILSSAEYKRIRTQELLNKETQKQIDTQIKQELGIKDTTNALGKYISKLATVVVVARKLAHFMGSAIKESANYIENLNLFAVAYGETYQQQLNWALGIAEAYGLANNEVIKFAGTFRELSTSLGLVGETADLVSQTVTNLGYDLSALFNTTVEQAMEKLQSGVFSGNVRPLRAYGIDISQNQIDALFETNEALRQLGVNARNLSQSDKVLARLIITLQSGKDSFGTMAREINNLQSQFRIFQGSLANFKLAIGDLIEQPLSKVMVLANAVVIALTNVIRTFVPLTTEDKNPVNGIAEGAESANKELDELQGKLAGFDKFNVLQSSGSNSNLSVTEELNKLLEQQAGIYDTQLNEALKDMKNEAVELAKKIQDLTTYSLAFIIVWSSAKALSIATNIKNIKTAISTLSNGLIVFNKGLSFTNVLIISGLVYSLVQLINAIKEGDKETAIFAGVISGVLVASLVLFNLETIKTIGLKLASWFHKAADAAVEAAWKWAFSTKTLEKQRITAKQVGTALVAMASAYLLADGIINSFGEEGRKVASVCMIVAGSIMAIVAALVAMNTSISWGTMLPVLLAGVGAAIAGVKGLTTEVKDIAGFAEGGYTNANLIMTHENGKREWVGKAAGSSAIVNDTQMSDIMEVAVAKGVYNALSARSDLNGGSMVEQPIIVKIGEQEVFTAVRKTAKKQGLGFANI